MFQKKGDKMEKTDGKFSAFQLGIIIFFLTGSLFVGLGITSMFTLSGRDIWVTSLIGIALSIIPALMYVYIFNYQPDKNIFEKNKILFGKIGGVIVNVLLIVFVYILMLLELWSTTIFAISIYLVKTPNNFIAGIYVLIAIYAVFKGIEVIGRTFQILFYISLFLIAIIIISLAFQFNAYFLKPILINGIMPIIPHVMNFLSYLFTPLIIMTVIPKNMIIKKKHNNKIIIGSFILGPIFMTIVFILVAGVLTPELASFYRLPAYYVQRKVSIGGVINNLENFLSIHWFFNTFITIIMGIFFITKYFETAFNIKKKIKRNIIIFILGVSIVYLQNYIFPNAPTSLTFMKYKFPLFFSLPLLVLILITIINIFVRRHKKKAT